MLVSGHRDLEVFRRSFDLAMRVFELSAEFPKEERYSLTDQIRRSSRSVSANLSEAWQKRRYEAAFIAKLTDAATEAAETQTWLDFAMQSGYVPAETAATLVEEYEGILKTLHSPMAHSKKWTMSSSSENGRR